MIASSGPKSVEAIPLFMSLEVVLDVVKDVLVSKSAFIRQMF